MAMALTDAKRRANNKYIAENMTVLGCKVRKEKAEQFKQLCKANGTTVNAVFTAAMDEFMKQYGKEQPKMIDVKYFDAAVELMDDELREQVHADLAPCTDEEFLREYERRHLEKYGEEFKI